MALTKIYSRAQHRLARVKLRRHDGFYKDLFAINLLCFIFNYGPIHENLNAVNYIRLA